MFTFCTFSAAVDREAAISASEQPSTSEAGAVYRIQRISWFAIVGLLVIGDLLPAWLSLHNGLTPLAAGIVFFLAGIMRRRGGWQHELSSWFAFALLLLAAVTIL